MSKFFRALMCWSLCIFFTVTFAHFTILTVFSPNLSPSNNSNYGVLSSATKQRLEEWINDNGGMIYNTKCKIMPQSGGRGLITTAPIQYVTYP